MGRKKFKAHHSNFGFAPAKQPKVRANSLTKMTTPIGSAKSAPTVFYSPEAWFSIQHLVEIAPKEVGWLGLVEELEFDYLITQIFIPEQTVTAAETDISSDAMMDLYNELIADGIDTSKLIYWGHSHVNMGVTPSGQDEIQVSEYLDSCQKFIRGIYNKAGVAKVDVYDQTAGYVYQCVDTAIDVPLSIAQKIEAEFEAKVTEYKYTNWNQGYSNPNIRNVANGLGMNGSYNGFSNYNAAYDHAQQKALAHQNTGLVDLSNEELGDLDDPLFPHV